MTEVPQVVRIGIDCETLGTAADSVILSIGATNNVTKEDFYAEIDSKGQCCRTIDIDTVRWWKSQSIEMPNGTIPLEVALHDLVGYIWRTRDYECNPLEIWANGTDFDIALLNNAYTQCGIQPAWKYNEVRDFRTMRKMFPEVQSPERQAEHHALADARWMMTYLDLILLRIERQRDNLFLMENGYVRPD